MKPPKLCSEFFKSRLLPMQKFVWEGQGLGDLDHNAGHATLCIDTWISALVQLANRSWVDQSS